MSQSILNSPQTICLSLPPSSNSIATLYPLSNNVNVQGSYDSLISLFLCAFRFFSASINALHIIIITLPLGSVKHRKASWEISQCKRCWWVNCKQQHMPCSSLTQYHVISNPRHFNNTEHVTTIICWFWSGTLRVWYPLSCLLYFLHYIFYQWVISEHNEMKVKWIISW
jgi:hypothetical protein